MKKIILIGVLIELFILLYFYFYFIDLSEVFRYSARYSGRLSLFVYLLCFYLFSLEYKQGIFNFTKKVTLVFAILHLIHFVYLSLSVFLNDLPIVPYKLLGGFIAYLFIIIYPLVIDKISNSIFHIIYFYYVGIVMAMTYIARIKGEFIGAPTELFHYVGLSLVLLSFIIYGYKLFKIKKE